MIINFNKLSSAIALIFAAIDVITVFLSLLGKNLHIYLLGFWLRDSAMRHEGNIAAKI